MLQSFEIIVPINLPKEDEAPGQKTATPAFMVNPENTMESTVRKGKQGVIYGEVFAEKSLSKT
jgi:hypothetical protein